ncbi:MULTISPECIES: TetR/AcrR family transcriptional regulator [Butyricimonas]|jgi:transcriptional regulator|uniref:TetR/AcrR family transcriptional regulator n=1 Tax=Butyricimonas TaxID=574697 RepID=UPI002087C75C|nr:TetR/AcrR family transcriptional regulator [Butyricimonas paravirosa]BDF53516.1 TetR family transcriptional regulator [Odoribacteraceae bacterium]GKH92455.1 TetR family transcriptional regulator [Odoribacteraceae bacterium]GKH97073.1 TetR family transcriptional regulator [Odoribacteraceae bacterium]GKI03952.1 TetR family transcriptional regulator [Odoribacteraceae bacterium]
MTESVNNENLETKIIEVAKQQFIENGFAETSMSDIAAKVGINRPGLHYYFRTKERMFQAVFGEIVLFLLPKIQDIVLQKDKPVTERVGGVIDAYFEVFSENPRLPLFVMRESNRDVNHLINTLADLRLERNFLEIARSLQDEMDSGRLKPVPLRFVFFTFYSLLIMPFVMKDLCASLFLEKGESFEEMFARWKPYIVMQMDNLLRVD